LRGRVGGARGQVAGQRQLLKVDGLGGGWGEPAGTAEPAPAPMAGYAVLGFGPQALPQALSLALAIHAAAAAAGAAAEAEAGEPGGGPVAGVWRVRVGIARGGVATGGLGAQRLHCHAFGGAAAAAARLARACPAGATRVQRAVARAAGAQAFSFYQPAAGLAADGPVAGRRGGEGEAASAAVGLAGRRVT
jgi:class 3 adenylate cyclase